jgi:hypothetical protein
VTALVLALQWGGNQKPWKDGSVIACFVVAGVLTIILVFWERYLGDKAMVPVAIFSKGKSIWGILAAAFFTRCSLLIFTYYIPILYQAVRHHNATKSGVDILAFMLSVVFSVIISGRLVAAFGRYWPFLVLGPIPGAIGAGLMYTVRRFFLPSFLLLPFPPISIPVLPPLPTLTLLLLYQVTPTTKSANIIGYQILLGVGVGTTMQNSLFAMQAEFKDNMRLVGQATSLASFAQFLGGTMCAAFLSLPFSSRRN